MKTRLTIACLLITSIIAAASLAGCRDEEDSSSTSIWSYNFMSGADVTGNSDWFFDGGYTGKTDLGFYMSQANIAAPVLFTGDFSVEFEFYLKLNSGEDEYIFRYAFRLTDPNWESSTNRRFCSFASYYTSFPEHEDAYYQTDQGNGSYTSTDFDGNVPGAHEGVNTCRMVKKGNDITIYMNNMFVRTITISTANQPQTGYAPFVHGHNSSDQADSNFYIRKITVTHGPGGRVDHSWN